MNRDAQGNRVIRVRSLLLTCGLFFAAITVAMVWQARFLWDFCYSQFRALSLGNSDLAAEKFGPMLAGSVDRIEISQIGGASGTNMVTLKRHSKVETFKCGPTQILTENEATRFIELWSGMHFDRGYAMFDHYPAFAIRFLWKGRSVLETTLSAHGSSFFAASESGDPFGFLGEQLIGFNRTTPPGLAFVAELQKRFPDSPEWAAIEAQKKRRLSAPAPVNSATPGPPQK